MSDRSERPADSRPTLGRPVRLQGGGRRRLGWRPAVEPLEGRALMSVGGGPDFTYGVGNVNTYGTKGLAVVNFAQTVGSPFESLAAGEAVQANGKLLVVGSESQGVFGGASTQRIISVSRLNADGTPDTGFGVGGAVNLPGPGSAVGLDQGEAVAVQADGKIVVLGDINPVTGSTPSEVAIYRLNSDGSLDATFGAGGSVFFRFEQGPTALSSTATTLAIDPNGRIVVGGLAATSGAALARFNADGTPDTGFNATGQFLVSLNGGSTPAPNSIGVSGLAIDANGKIDYETTVVPASGLGTGTQIEVGRINADGTPDTSFGPGGEALLSASISDTAGALAIQADGKIVVTGAYFSTSTTPPTSHFDLFRLNLDGTPDTTFGAMGKASLGDQFVKLYSLSTGINQAQAVAKAVVIQPDGKIVVGGAVEYDASGSQSMPTLGRVDADGSTDLTFGTGGFLSLDVLDAGYSDRNTYFHSIYGLAIGSNGQVLATLNDGEARLLTTGAPNDFDNDGKTDLAIFIPSQANFAYRPSSGGPDVLFAFGAYGSGSTLPAPGAYNGAGITELGVYLPQQDRLAVRTSLNNTPTTTLYVSGDSTYAAPNPAPADYTGSGVTNIATFNPYFAAFVYSTNPLDPPPATVVPFGSPGVGNSIPVPADYDGSGHDELGVYLPALGAFAYRPANGGPDVIIPFGTPGAGNSIPVPGDYDGSGHTELAVYLPALGAFAYRPYGGGTTHDVIIPFGTPGVGGSLPAPGDYTGSGHLELGVYLPALGAFAYRPATGGITHDVIVPFGLPGAGVSIPFEAISSTDGAFSSGGGGGSASGIASGGGSGGYLDFVPDLAGQKKGKGSSPGQVGA